MLIYKSENGRNTEKMIKILQFLDLRENFRKIQKFKNNSKQLEGKYFQKDI